MPMSQAEREAIENPSTLSEEFLKMHPRWQLVNTLLGGTESMRASGQKYLPPHTNEDTTSYMERLDSATLLNMTEITLKHWVGKPFAKPVQLTEETPQPIRSLEDDIDLQGTDIAIFLRRWFSCGLARGHSHVLVDFPRVEPIFNDQGEEVPRTLADDQRDNMRPYWVPIRPENVIFAFSELINGEEVLTHVRIREMIVERVGFTSVTKQRIRVLEPGSVTLYELQSTRRNKEKWVIVDSYFTGIDFIPLVTFYSEREGLMLSKSPLLDLAHLNVEHFQSKSDQRAILTVTRFPMLALSGGTDDEGELTVGPHKWLFTPDPQGKFYYVEHTGAAIEAGRQDLIDLEEQMALYGAQFLKKRPGSETATARAIDSADATSPLQDVTMQFIEAVNLALFYTALWLRLDDGGKIEISTEFGMDSGVLGEIQLLAEMRRNRDISRNTVLSEARRRGILAETFDADSDAEFLESEALLLGDAQSDIDPEQVDFDNDDNGINEV